MDDEANQGDERAALTIKNFPITARKVAMARATMRGETMADWVARAVRTQAELESGDRIIPPASMPRDVIPRGSMPHDVIPRGSIPHDDVIPPGSIPRTGDMLAATMGFLTEVVALHEKANVAVPAGMLREARLTATAMMRELRGVERRRPAARTSQMITQGLPENGGSLTGGKIGFTGETDDG